MSVLIDSYSESNQDDDWNLYGSSEGIFGQTFTGDGNNLGSVKFYLKKSGSPTGEIYADVYAHTGTYGTDGTPTGDALATSEGIDVSTLGTSYSLVIFNFYGEGKVELVDGAHYVVCVRFQGGDSSNKVLVGNDGSSSTHDGNYVYWVDPVWYGENYSDVCFYVYSSTPLIDTKYPLPAFRKS